MARGRRCSCDCHRRADRVVLRVELAMLLLALPAPLVATVVGLPASGGDRAWLWMLLALALACWAAIWAQRR